MLVWSQKVAFSNILFNMISSPKPKDIQFTVTKENKMIIKID